MKSNYNYGSLAAFVDLTGFQWLNGYPRIFPVGSPLEVEIGFGTGEYILGLGVQNPAVNFIGFEQCPTRIIKTLRKLHQHGVANSRVMRIDAAWGFRFVLAPGSVNRVHCLFPCPWPKKKHAKHRLFQPAFLRLVRSRLKEGGTLRIVTDQQLYADWIEEQLAETGFSLARAAIGAVHGTKFEKKWQEGGQEQFHELVLTADQPYKSGPAEVPSVQTYSCDDFDPDRLVLEGVSGPVTVSFPEYLFDTKRNAGMVHAIVSEDQRMMHLWVVIERAARGWRVAPAEGTLVLPTEGARKAMELVFQAVEQSVK
ncbi:MAG: hypothetical protein HQL20_11270 [Candidatus Omnitrophica bacterium]|nr:hypothetical protein [Candidatus Omnitrophota bacterium]